MTMHTTRLTSIAVAVLLSSSVTAQRSLMQAVDTLSDLVALNPNFPHLTTFVVEQGAVYTFDRDSTAETNETQVLKPLKWPGRWSIQPITGINIGDISGMATATLAGLGSSDPEIVGNQVYVSDPGQEGVFKWSASAPSWATVSNYVSTVTVSSGVATVKTPRPHLLTTGASVPMNGADIRMDIETFPVNVESLVISGNVATVTTSRNHGYVTDDYVRFHYAPRLWTAAERSRIANEHKITVTGATTFTFTVRASNNTASSASYLMRTTKLFGIDHTFAVSGISVAGNTATVTTVNTHGLRPSLQYVTIAGATPSELNGRWIATTTDTNTFTYTGHGASSGAATGTITCSTLRYGVAIKATSTTNVSVGLYVNNPINDGDTVALSGITGPWSILNGGPYTTSGKSGTTFNITGSWPLVNVNHTITVTDPNTFTFPLSLNNGRLEGLITVGVRPYADIHGMCYAASGGFWARVIDSDVWRASWFGLSPGVGGDASVNRAALQLAFDTAPVGANITVPTVRLDVAAAAGEHNLVLRREASLIGGGNGVLGSRLVFASTTGSRDGLHIHYPIVSISGATRHHLGVQGISFSMPNGTDTAGEWCVRMVMRSSTDEFPSSASHWIFRENSVGSGGLTEVRKPGLKIESTRGSMIRGQFDNNIITGTTLIWRVLDSFLLRENHFSEPVIAYSARAQGSWLITHNTFVSTNLPMLHMALGGNGWEISNNYFENIPNNVHSGDAVLIHAEKTESTILGNVDYKMGMIRANMLTSASATNAIKVGVPEVVIPANFIAVNTFDGVSSDMRGVVFTPGSSGGQLYDQTWWTAGAARHLDMSGGANRMMFRSPIRSTGAYFDGTSHTDYSVGAHVVSTNIVGLNPGTNNFVMGVRFLMPATTVANRFNLVGLSPSATIPIATGAALFGYNSGRLTITFNTGADTVDSPSLSTVHNGKWVDAMVARVHGEIKFVVNGMPLASETFTGNQATTPPTNVNVTGDRAVVGKYNNTRSWTGMIGEAWIAHGTFDIHDERVLSRNTWPPAVGTKVHWRFDVPTGSVVVDNSANGVDGVIGDGVTFYSGRFTDL